jgi:heterotetrameric sarcosine oxidase gamma subunit
MTAISPLQSIHKKGLFGDHHKKNEGELLRIKEVTNLSIIQIVQYKNSKIELKNIKIDSLEFPFENSKALSNISTRILWNGPSTWLIISNKKNILKKIQTNLNNENFAITDISHSRAVIQVKGHQAKEVLKKGCPINFNEFNKNDCAGSVYHGINIVVDCVDDNPQTYNLLTLRSFGESLYHHMTDASLEFGYVGV